MSKEENTNKRNICFFEKKFNFFETFIHKLRIYFHKALAKATHLIT